MRQNKILSLSADLERVMRELEAIMREALLSSNEPDESFTKRKRKLLIQITTHLREDLIFYQQQRRILWRKVVGLKLLQGCLAILPGVSASDNCVSPLADTLSEEYRFFRNEEHECRKKLRDLEAILEIGDVENTDKPPW